MSKKDMEIDPNCCEVWPVIAPIFSWKCLEDKPKISTMPHIIGTDGTEYFVNNCPSCGKYARNRNMLTSDTINKAMVQMAKNLNENLRLAREIMDKIKKA